MRTATASSFVRQSISQSQPQILRLGIIYDVTRSSAPITTRAAAALLVSNSGLSAIRRTPLSHRPFHTSPTAYKKKKDEQKRGASNSNGGKAAADSSSPSTGTSGDEGSKHPQPSPEEPLDFADVESRLRKHAEHFKAGFKKLHAGGRFDPDAIGAIRVTVDKKEGLVYPLHELAQVVPRGGRAVSLLVHDKEYVKPIMSAVQTNSGFNQQPQRDPDNELELTLKVEAEKREDVVRRVKATAHEWRERVRAVRQKRDKLHTTWKKDGSMGPDLKRTVDKALEKVIKTAIAEIDEAEKNALKAVER